MSHDVLGGLKTTSRHFVTGAYIWQPEICGAIWNICGRPTRYEFLTAARYSTSNVGALWYFESFTNQFRSHVMYSPNRQRKWGSYVRQGTKSGTTSLLQAQLLTYSWTFYLGVSFCRPNPYFPVGKIAMNSDEKINHYPQLIWSNYIVTACIICHV